jgi:hypothetical protein
MEITDFAIKYRLKVTKDECGDSVIVGRIDQSNIYEYSDTEFGVMIITDGRKPPRTQLYNTFKRVCLGVGMTLRQSGDAEGAFSFDWSNPAQVKAAIKGIRARFKRKVSPEALAKLAQTGFNAKNTAVEAFS